MTAQAGNFASPANELVAVVPSDATVLVPTRGLWVGTVGDVAVIGSGPGQSAVTIKNVPSGTLLPVCVTKVMATNTTAANIVALR